MTTPLNNGTNACAILSVGLAESILHDTETEAFLKNVPKAVVVTILSLPEEMNKHRNMGKTYDILEAYEILCQQQLLTYPLEFYEELPHAICTNSFVLAIGCYKGKPFMINTHPVAPPIGNGMAYFLTGSTTPLRCGCLSARPFGRGFNHSSIISSYYT